MKLTIFSTFRQVYIASGDKSRSLLYYLARTLGVLPDNFQLPIRAQGAAAQKEDQMESVIKWEASRRKALSGILKQFPELWGVCQIWSCNYAMRSPLPVVKTADKVLDKEPNSGRWWVVSSDNEGGAGRWLCRDLMRLDLSGSDRTLRQTIFTHFANGRFPPSMASCIRIRYLVWYHKAEGRVEQDVVIYKPQSGSRFITI